MTLSSKLRIWTHSFGERDAVGGFGARSDASSPRLLVAHHDADDNFTFNARPP